MRNPNKMVCFSTESAALWADYFSARSLFGAFCSFFRLPNSILSCGQGAFWKLWVCPRLGGHRTVKSFRGSWSWWIFANLPRRVCDEQSNGVRFKISRLGNSGVRFLSPTSVSHWFAGLIKALVIFLHFFFCYDGRTAGHCRAGLALMVWHPLLRYSIHLASRSWRWISSLIG